ncbi:MAG: holo-[acyl-carrier protein] synthase [Clostridiales bacterium]|nr:holo-[acyl-carrier protein] synthase [Clostridiales bacterium]
MIVGIGTDMIEIARVKKACSKEAFLKRYFTEAERQLFLQSMTRAADNFAVKEAIVKMFGTGFREVVPIEIEVLRNDLGAPFVNLYGAALAYKKRLKIDTIHVSITNTKEYASAFVVGESKDLFVE